MATKAVVCTLIMLASFSTIKAQYKSEEILHQNLYTATTDSSRLQAIGNLYMYYANQKITPDSADVYVERMISEGRKQNLTVPQVILRLLDAADSDTLRVLIYNDLASWLCTRSPDSALAYGKQALTLSRKINDRAGEWDALAILGDSYQVIGDIPKALELHMKAQKIAEKIERPDLNAASNHGICNMYLELREYDLALHYLRESDRIMRFPIYLYEKLGTIHYLQRNIDSAEYYYGKLYDYVIDKNVTWFKPTLFLKTGKVKAAKGNNAEAIEDFKRSLALHPLTEEYDISTNVSALNEMAKAYDAGGQWDSSVYYANKALDLSMEGRYYAKAVQACNILADLYREKDINKALMYTSMASAAKDSLSEFVRRNAVDNVTNFDVQERQYELDKANTAYKNSLRQYGLLAGIVVFSIIAIILYRNNSQKQKANARLQEQKDELQRTLLQLKSTQSQLVQAEKMASLGELTAGIAHEIQNPLNFVNNFSDVNKEIAEELVDAANRNDLDEVKDLARSIRDNQEKISYHGLRADSIVKSMLQHSRTSTGTKEPTDLNALAEEYLRLSYHGMRARDKSFNSDFEFRADPELTKMNVVPQDIGRVLLNLLNNAFYAVGERKKKEEADYSPKVILSTKSLNGSVEICVEDNGTGIPENVKQKIFQPFYTTKPTGEGTGLGLSLSYDIITKGHGGEITVESVPGKTVFRVIM